MKYLICLIIYSNDLVHMFRGRDVQGMQSLDVRTIKGRRDLHGNVHGGTSPTGNQR